MDYIRRFLAHETTLLVWTLCIIVGLYLTHLIWKAVECVERSKLNLALRLACGACITVAGWITLGFTIQVFMREYPGLGELMRGIAEAIWVPLVFLKITPRKQRTVALIPAGIYAAFWMVAVGLSFNSPAFNKTDVAFALINSIVTIGATCGLVWLLAEEPRIHEAPTSETTKP